MNLEKRKQFLVLGAGSWGSALALYLTRQQHDVVIWGHHEAEIQSIITRGVNERYLPGFYFGPSLKATSDLKEAFELAGEEAILLIAVPSHVFNEMMLRIKPYLTVKMGILWATKGLSPQGEFLHVVCQQSCDHQPLGVISGPSFAKEVASGLPTAVTIATESPSFGQQMVEALHSEMFRVYLSQDLIGVQLGGAVKNVLAIAVGMSDGLGFGANARAALITRGLAELCRLGNKLGAQWTTLMGLSGVGDVVLTCTDNQSRNRRFGLALGEGQAIVDAQKSIGQVVEGKMNAKQIIALANKHQVEMPICQQVYAVLYEALPPKQAVNNLLKREPKNETFV